VKGKIGEIAVPDSVVLTLRRPNISYN